MKTNRIFVFIVALSLATASADTLEISEFMASNTRGLADEDGAFSDWIELHNPGPTPVNLDGWHLTDNPAQLTQWSFPATNLQAGAYLVVFASGEDRRRAGAPLHTNFRLSAGGEYLALVRPDGVTITSEFRPAFPPQVADVSFGLDTGLRITELVGLGASGRVFAPVDDTLGTNWVRPAFDDSAWLGATNALGFASASLRDAVATQQLIGHWRFDETRGTTATNSATFTNHALLNGFSTNQSPWVTGKVRGALRLNGSTHYGRVNHYPKSTNTTLSVAAWVWADARPAWASIAKNWAGSGGQFHFGLRESAGDLDIFINTTGGQFNVREGQPLPLNSWQHVAFVADGANLRLYRNGVEVASTNYSGRFTTAPNPLGVGVKLNDGGSGPDTGAPGFWQGMIDDLGLWNRALSAAEVRTLHEGGSPFNEWIATDTRPLLSGRDASCYARFPFVLDHPAVLTRWRLQVRYADGFAAWLNGEEIVRRNAPAELAWNSAATSARSVEDARQAEEFDLSFFEEFLRPGTNVLAVQGLRVSSASPYFLLQPVVEAASVTNTTNALVYFTTPTPGAENRVGTAVLGPIIKAVAHLPPVPTDNQDVIVTARVAPAFAPISAVTLRYRVMYSNEVSALMLDDGLHGDGRAGDGVFGATIPAAASRPGQMLRYAVSAVDTQGRTHREPLFQDLTRSPQYFGTVIADGSITSALPVLHWFVASTTAADTETGTRCSLFFLDEFYDNLFIRIRGGTARGWPKKSYKIQFHDDHLFRFREDVERVDEINLNATYTDKSYLRSLLTYEHQRDAGTPSTEVYPVHVRQNAQFFSVALVTEQLQRAWLRRHGLDPNGAFYKGGPGSTYDTPTSFEKKTRVTEGNSDLVALLNGLRLTGTNLERFVFDSVNLPAQVNFLATVCISQNIDASDKNHFLYRDTEGSGEWHMCPYDLDLTLGPNALNTDTMVASQDFASHPYIGARPYLLHDGKYNRLIEGVVNTPRARQMLARRIRTLTDQFLVPPYFQQRIDKLLPRLAPDVLADKSRWGANAAFPGQTYTLQQAADRINNEYLTPRLTYLNGPQLAALGIPARQASFVPLEFGAVEFNPASGRQDEEYIELRNTNTFAVDLSGWELRGEVTLRFAPGTVLPASNRLFAVPNVAAFRARAASPRGGEGHFVQGNYEGRLSARGGGLRLVDTSGREAAGLAYAGAPSPAQQFLRITEILFNPAPASGGTSDAQDFEFVELRNTGPAPLDLTGIRFAAGVQFGFTGSAVTNLAPGARVLVVKSRLAFTARYGDRLPVAGEFIGNLENRGERLRVEDAVGEKILEFDYDNRWYPITDGHGFSLTIVNDAALWKDWDQAASWRPSSQLHGSPGAGDAPPPAIPAIVINEGLSRTDVPPPLDSLELYNPTPHAVNLGGWFLSDDFNTPKKFRIPDGTVIGAGDYLVFDELQFNPRPGVPPSFAFSSDGDEAWLFSGDAATNLTGYVHGFAFGAAEDGVTLGVHVTSAGEAHVVAQTARSLGAANAGPRVGSVVISEIMFRPPDQPVLRGATPDLADDTRGEFIELHNGSSRPVDLFHRAQATHTWRLRGAVEFDFPTNRVLPAGGFMLVVSFDPEADAAALADFRARYGLPANAQVIGPYAGKLDNSDEVVELLQPDDTSMGRVPYLLVERVAYGDRAPWPAGADGTGASLQRQIASAYGNDPTNWFAGWPTPGAPSGVGSAPAIAEQPLGQVVVAFNTVSLTVRATSSSPMKYQWRHEGVNLLEATNATLTLSNIQPRQAGAYHAVVFNAAGTTLSSNATLTILLGPSFTVQPRSQNVVLGANATLTVSAFGTPPLAYQWRFNGRDLPGATATNLVLTNAQLAHAGAYTVWVTDAVGTLISQPAFITVVERPAIVVQPAPAYQEVLIGGTLSLRVVATGTPPLSYRWRRGTSTVTGQTNATLLLTNLQPSQAGTYTVVITNVAGPGILSSHVSVVVLADDDRDGMADGWEGRYGMNTNHAADAIQDFDGDGLDNREEYEAGTDPTNALSLLRLEAQVAEPGRTRLRFFAISNRVYGVEWKESLLAGQWGRLGEVEATSANRWETVLDPYPMTQERVYRVLTPRREDPRVGPVILQSPRPVAAGGGQGARFSLVAVGTGPLSYQWRRDGADLPGATEPWLEWTNVPATAAGEYSVQVSDERGVNLSASARLTVKPWLVSHPSSQTVGAGDSVTFSVEAKGEEPLQYRWYRNGHRLAGETNATLTLTIVQPSDAGSYWVLVSHLTPLGWQGAASPRAELKVLPSESAR